MTALASAPTPRVAEEAVPLDEQQHILMREMSWALYEKLLRDVGNGHLRITFDQGRMEIMSPLPEHEHPSRAIAAFILMMAVELDIPICSLGSSTLRRKDLEKGLEPDECFYVQNEARMRGKKRLDLLRDPPPDLIIEVDITHRSVPKLPIYAAIGVPEIWRWDKGGLRCHLLRGGKYRIVEKSRAFPMLRVSDLEPFVRRFDAEDQTTVMRAFRDWARETFL